MAQAAAQAHVDGFSAYLQTLPYNDIVQTPLRFTQKVTAPALPTLANDAPLAKTVVRLEQNDTVTAAYQLQTRYPDERISVLNFANPTNPGGGFIRGGRGQEEDLCHCSNLYNALHAHRGLYPFRDNELLWSPLVCFTRLSGPNGYQNLTNNNWFYVDVISCAAIRNPPTDRGAYRNDRDLQLMRSKIIWIVNQAATRGANRLVLGAFGCGAFANPVRAVASLMKDVLVGTDANPPAADWASHGLKEIVIAVPQMGQRPDPTWSQFMNVFHEQSVQNAASGPAAQLVQHTVFPPNYVAPDGA